jgi:hypothetical protein
MEWVIYFMIALMAFAPSLGLPILINSEDAGGSTNAINSSSGESMWPNSDPSSLEGVAGALGGITYNSQ